MQPSKQRSSAEKGKGRRRKWLKGMQNLSQANSQECKVNTQHDTNHVPTWTLKGHRASALTDFCIFLLSLYLTPLGMWNREQRGAVRGMTDEV